MKETLMRIREDAHGATDVDHTDRGARVRSAADSLVDWVYEVSAFDWGMQFTKEQLGVIRSMVASAMIHMFDDCEKLEADLVRYLSLTDEQRLAENAKQMAQLT
jgi:hypothetical protein